MYEIIDPDHIKNLKDNTKAKNNNYKCIAVGLIGTIGSGKTTVRKAFQACGIETIDADQILRQLYKPDNSVYEKVVEIFTPEILDENRQIDRKKLGAIVFNDKQKLAQLEQITHKKINEVAQEFFSQGKSGQIKIYEATKLIESQFINKLDLVIMVDADMDTRKKRLKKNRNMTDEQIQRILANQASIVEMKKHSHILIDNSKDLNLDPNTPEAISQLVQNLNIKQVIKLINTTGK